MSTHTSEPRYKSVKLLPSTYNELAKLGTVNDSFDDVIKKLLKSASSREVKA
jgi:hypothetical protein